MNRLVFGGTAVALAAVVTAILALSGGSGSTCPPYPAFPNAGCTGVPAGTSLTVHTGNLETGLNGQVIDAVDVQGGCILVRHYGVTIRNSRAECIIVINDQPSADPANPPLTVTDSEIDCGGTAAHPPPTWNTGISFRNYVVTRTEIHNCENGLDIGTNVALTDSWIHDLYQCTVAGCPGELDQPHTDGIQSNDGSNTLIDHNTIYAFTPPCTYPNPSGLCNGTSAVNINHDSGGPSTTNLTISHNLLAGGAFALYCPLPADSGVSVTANHFSTIYSPTVGEFAPSTACGDDSQSGNVTHETGAALELG